MAAISERSAPAEFNVSPCRRAVFLLEKFRVPHTAEKRIRACDNDDFHIIVLICFSQFGHELVNESLRQRIASPWPVEREHSYVTGR